LLGAPQPHRTSTTTSYSGSGSGSGSTPPLLTDRRRGSGSRRDNKDKRLSWGEASTSSTAASPRRKRIAAKTTTGADGNANQLRPTLSNEFPVLRNNNTNNPAASSPLSRDDAALVECLGREEEDHRHEEIQKALKRHNVTLNQLNLAEIEMYGRDKELALLLDVHQAVAANNGSDSASVGIANVVGKAGTGKTRLCQEFLGRTRASGALVLKGKFDLQNRQEPYTGIQAAFADLPAHIMSIDDASKRSSVLNRIRTAVGANVRLVSSLMPCIEQVLQLPQPETAAAVASEGESGLGQELARDDDSASADSGGNDDASGVDPDNDDFNDPHATRSVRLHLLFRDLVRALCDPAHPVILFLDDAQWSDAPSLSLIGNLISDPRLSHFVLVSTCREEQEENEGVAGAAAASGFKGLMDDVRGGNMPRVRVESIRLPLLNQEAVYSIVSTALRSSEERAFKLSEIVHQKSNGNPMYVIQFLIGLFEDGFLRYNIGSMQWTWDELNVRSRFVTDNVVELAEARLLRLNASQQQILMVAACLGQIFDPPKLEFVLTDPKVHSLLPLQIGDLTGDEQLETKEIDWNTKVRDHLEELVEEAIIEYIAPLNTYCFIHDLIQQAAFELIPEPLRIRVQCEVGQRLLRCQEPATVDDKYYFRAVELANVGVNELLEDDGPDRVELAYVNDDAGQKAMAKAAYSAALKYFDAGLLWLGPDAWSTEPTLALDLSSGAVEAAFCSGDFDTMEARMASVLDRDLPVEDKVRVYLIRISSYGVQYRHELCLEIAVKVLKEMGITRLPLRPRSYQVVLEAIKTKLLLRNRTEESLTSLPLIESKRWLQAMSITDMLQQIAYNSNQNFFAVMRLRSLRWTLNHGVCSYTPSLFAAYALLLCATGDVQKGHVMGTISEFCML
jgi:predicted ATPase